MSLFVCVPGAGGDPFVFHRLLPLLESAGHRAVAVDLPAADPHAGLAAYADAVVTAAAAHDGSVTLVAASMGAYSASMAVAPLVDAGREVAGIVLVNAMTPAPGESPGEWWEATGQPQARAEAERAAGRDPDAPFDPVDGFFHDVPEDVRSLAFERGDPQQADRPFGNPWPLEGWPDVPTRGVAGADDRLFPAGFQQRTARRRLALELDVVPGGHLLPLARPDVLADYLLG